MNIKRCISYTQKNNSFRLKCQERKVRDIIPTIKEFLDDPEKFIRENLNRSEIAILGHMLAMANCLKDLYPTQAYVANKVGISRVHANKSFRTLREFKFVDYNYRHLTSCEYKISSYFDDPKVREKLKTIFKALWYLPLSLLMAQEATLQEQFTQVKQIYEENKREYNNRFKILEHNLVYGGKFDNFNVTTQQMDYERDILARSFDYDSHNSLSSSSHSFLNKKYMPSAMAKRLENKVDNKVVKQVTWAVKNIHPCCGSCLGKYCCGSCELNKITGPLPLSGNLRTCDKVRKLRMELDETT